MLGVLTLSTAATLPSRLMLYQNYNGINGIVETAVRENHLRKGLILFDVDDWHLWGEVANLLSADLHADLVFANRRADNKTLFRFYAGYPVYLWDGSTLQPFVSKTDEK